MSTIFTIGHSTREIDEFIKILKKYGIEQIADIRTIPKSRHNPQFGQDKLKDSLEKAGIEYVHLSKLGGLRPATKNLTNLGWHNKSFRNYADYMQTDDFLSGLSRLIKLAKNITTAIMCAEAVPWRCHRSLVSDALVVRDIPVCEIISVDSTRKHSLTDFAIVKGTFLTYPKSSLTEKKDISLID